MDKNDIVHKLKNACQIVHDNRKIKISIQRIKKQHNKKKPEKKNQNNVHTMQIIYFHMLLTNNEYIILKFNTNKINKTLKILFINSSHFFYL